MLLYVVNLTILGGVNPNCLEAASRAYNIKQYQLAEPEPSDLF